MTNERLAELIQGGDIKLLPSLWENVRLLIFKKCAGYWRFYSETLERHGYSLDDLRQESYNALIFAVKQYKSDREYKFTSYLDYALKNVIRGLTSGADALSRSETQSLEQPLSVNENGEPLLVGDIVPDERAETAFEDIERLSEYAALYEAVDALPPDQRCVIVEYYFKGLTYKQIDELHKGISARITLFKALKALRTGKLRHWRERGS